MYRVPPNKPDGTKRILAKALLIGVIALILGAACLWILIYSEPQPVPIPVVSWKAVAR